MLQRLLVSPFLLDHCVDVLDLAAVVLAALMTGTDRSLVYMFDDRAMLARGSDAFMAVRRARSKVSAPPSISESDLSGAMPSIWQALDFNVVPWSGTV